MNRSMPRHLKLMGLMSASLLCLVPTFGADRDPEPQSTPPAASGTGQQPAATTSTKSLPPGLPSIVYWAQSKGQAMKDSATPSQAQQANASKSTPKQSQSISIDQGSTSLIDQSNGADLLSTAFNLTPVSSGTASGATSGTSGTQGSGTVTASLYSIYSLANPKQDPLKSDVYNAHPGLRKFFFTIGREQLNSTSSSTTSSTNSSSNGSATPSVSPRAATSASSTTSSTSPNQPGTVYGVQWLIVNRRDASSIINNSKEGKALRQAGIDVANSVNLNLGKLIAAVCGLPADPACVKVIEAPGSDSDQATKDVQTWLDAHADAKKKAEDWLTQNNVYQRVTAASNEVTNEINHLEQLPQWSLNFQTTQRTAGLPNDYQGELIYDRGIPANWHFIFNGSYDYSDSSKIGADLRTERGAVQFSRNLVQSATAQKSLQFNLSGEGEHQDTGWHYRAQLQLVVPISTGINLPLSFGYTNETDVLRQEEKGVYGKFGLTIDFAKIVDALRPSK